MNKWIYIAEISITVITGNDSDTDFCDINPFIHYCAAPFQVSVFGLVVA